MSETMMDENASRHNVKQIWYAVPEQTGINTKTIKVTNMTNTWTVPGDTHTHKILAKKGNKNVQHNSAT